MKKGKHTLKAIAETKPDSKEKTPKSEREESIKELGIWLAWNDFSMQRNSKEFNIEKLEAEMLEVLKKQKITKKEMPTIMSRMLAEIVQLKSNLNISIHALTKIRNLYKELERIEKVKNKGGRPTNMELVIVGFDCYKKYLANHSQQPPSGETLSNLIEVDMQKLKGCRKKDKDGNPTNRKYVSPRTARDWLAIFPELELKDSWQELVNSYTT